MSAMVGKKKAKVIDDLLSESKFSSKTKSLCLYYNDPKMERGLLKRTIDAVTKKQVVLKRFRKAFSLMLVNRKLNGATLETYGYLPKGISHFFSLNVETSFDAVLHYSKLQERTFAHMRASTLKRWQDAIDIIDVATIR